MDLEFLMQFAIVFLLASALIAQDSEAKRLLEEYRRAVSELRAFYQTLTFDWQQVEIQHPKLPEVKHSVKAHFSNGMFRGERKWTSNEGSIASGSTRFDVSNNKHWFEVMQRAPGNEKVLSSFRVVTPDRAQSVYNNYPVAVAPFAFWEFDIGNVLDMGEAVVLGLTPVSNGESSHVLELAWKDGKKKGRLYVDRRRKWALRSFEVGLYPAGFSSRTSGVFHAALEYTALEGFPVPTRLERWMHHTKTGEKRAWLTADDVHVEKKKWPDSFFSLGSFGLETPGANETPSFPWPLFFLVMFVLSLIALVIRRLRRRS